MSKIEALRTGKLDVEEIDLDDLIAHIGDYQKRRGAIIEGGSSLASKLLIGRLPLSVEVALVAKLRKDGKKQGEVASMLDTSRSHVVRLEQIYTLAWPLRHRLFNGKLRISTALALSQLPGEMQEEYFEKDEITLREAQARLRKEKIGRIKLSDVVTPREPRKCPHCGGDL